MPDRAAAAAIAPSGVRRCRLPVREESRRPCAPSGLDTLAHPRYARRPAARQHLLPDAGIGDVELSCAPLGRWPYIDNDHGRLARGKREKHRRKHLLSPPSEVCSLNISRPYTDATDWSVHGTKEPC